MCAPVSTNMLNRSISRSCFKQYQQRFTHQSRIFFLLQMEGAIPPPRPVITPRKLEILYFPSPISTFLVRNSFIARPSGERLALVLYVVCCVLIKNFRLSELPFSLPLHFCSLSLRFLSPLFVKLRGGDIYKSVI